MDDLISRLRAMAGSDMVPMEKAMKLLREAADLGYQLRTTAKVSNTAMGAKLAASAREARNG